MAGAVRATPPPSVRRRRMLVVLMLAISVAIAGGAAVLAIGRDTVAAPLAPPFGAVSGVGARCLGADVSSVQSGVQLVLATGTEAGDVAGEDIVSGTVSRVGGRGVLHGTCAAGTPLAGRPADVDVRISRAAAIVTGSAAVGDAQLAFVITPAEPTQNPVGQLEGDELLARIFLASAVIVVAARGLGLAMTRIRQPRVVGEIIAGIVLGPSLLGLVWPEATAFLFPPQVVDVLRVMSGLGLVLFMFLIGLELDMRLVRSSAGVAAVVSQVSTAIPLVVGMATALVVFPRLGNGRFTPFALFLGAALAVTAFPVLSRILTDTGLHRTRLGAVAITCAAVGDVLAWCILAVVVAIVKADGPADAVRTIALTVAFAALMIVVVRPIAARVVHVDQRRGGVGSPVIVGILVGVLLSAWATERIGVHPIFGAFLAGAVLPRSRRLEAEITTKFQDLTVLLLLPIFFAVVGLSTRVDLLTGGDVWLVAALVLVAAVGGKFLSTLAASLAAGLGLRFSSSLGLLMNARGLTEIVILTVGRNLGVISPAVFTILVLMALATTFMTTPLLAVTYPRRVIEREWVRVAALDRLEAAGTRRVLVAVTTPTSAPFLAAFASRIEGPAEEPPALVLAHVTPIPGREEVRANFASLDRAAGIAARDFEPLREQCEASGVPTELAVVAGDDAGSELARLATQAEADLVLVGAHEAYVGRNLLGGVVADLRRSLDCDIAVVVEPELLGGLTHDAVAVFFTGTAGDLATLRLGAGLARGLDTGLRVLRAGDADVPAAGHPVTVVDLAEPSVEAVRAALGGGLFMVSIPVRGEDSAHREDLLVAMPGARVAMVRMATRLAPDPVTPSVPAVVGRPADD